MAFFKLNDSRLLASVDLGSYLIKCTVFEKSDELPLKILSSAEQRSSGLEDSRIIDFESLALALSEVLSQAEEQAQGAFTDVWLGFSPPFHFCRSYGMAALPHKEVSRQDLDLAIQTAGAIPLPNQHICLHQRPEAFYVDSKKEVINPLGLSGLRLEARVGLFNILESYKNTVHKALKILGYRPKAFFHNLIAFGEHFTSFEEKTNGICFCDIGHTSSRVILYQKNKIQNLFSIPIGGKNLTQAIANQFQLSFSSAETLKHQQGRVLCGASNENTPLECPETGIYISRKSFFECLESVFAQLLDEMKEKIGAENLEQLAEGFVFTGASSYIKGFLDFAGLRLGRPMAHKNLFYENFTDNQNLALIQQAYLENKLNLKTKQDSFSFIKELF